MKKNWIKHGRDYVRELVRLRDNHTCQLCGKVWSSTGKRLDVHHLNGVCGKKSRKYDRKEDMDTLITYCHSCHINLPEVKAKISLGLRG